MTFLSPFHALVRPSPLDNKSVLKLKKSEVNLNPTQNKQENILKIKEVTISS